MLVIYRLSFPSEEKKLYLGRYILLVDSDECGIRR